ncbi:hypothetical protein R5R35_012569 [Gryllus longicercus]|uniref:Uncharacterized protein n=1 Tax=Gryllus longicercus TaxID=2509291 RepID=A0AAN9Z758_9ORTH
MRIPTVQKCCCGCNLRLGSAIIGVLFFLSGLSQLITYSVQADNAEQNGEGDNKATYIVSAVLAAIMMLSTGLLLLGVHKEREGLLKPWLIIYSILAGIAILVSIIGAIVAFAIAEAVIGAALLITGIILLLVYGYCLVVVYSYYLSLSGIQPGTV